VLVPSVVATAGGAQAAAGLALTKTASGSVRAGEPITYTLTASNPGTEYEWNLSFRDVLPPDVTYVAGSTSPARVGEPSSATDGSGQTVLTWPNIADVVPGGTFTLTFQVVPDPVAYPVGSTVTNPGAQVYANTDPQTAPTFDASGTVVPGTSTESATAPSAATTITGLELTKSEPSPEGELLRGVHDNWTTYTLTLTAAQAGGSSGVVLVDYLPASLELLGCGGVDNTTGGAPEYPGAPALGAGVSVPGCVQPDAVTTVVDPPGRPAGVYTRVEWDLGAIAAGAVVTVPYAAGIPLRENTAWPGAQPAGLGEIANLDNNTGPSTRETATEASATNQATATGTYAGPVADGATPDESVSAQASVTIEDLRMHKAVSPTTFSAGDVATYTLTIDASEYVDADDVVVTDTIPAGVCPLGGLGTNYANGAPPICAGTPATAPSTPYDTVTDNGDGTFTVTFQPISVDADGTATITYHGRMLPAYLEGPRAGEPTTTGDTFTNTVELTGTTTPAVDGGESGSQPVTDDSHATQTTVGPTYGKTLLPRRLTDGGDCPTDATLYGEPGSMLPAERQFLPGDLVCFDLRVAFPDDAQTRNATVADFLPTGVDYVLGSAQAADLPPGTTPATFTTTSQSTRSVVFAIGAPAGGDPRFTTEGAVFDVVIQARVVTGTANPVGETRTNQFKLGIESADGTVTAYRDFDDITVLPPAPIDVVKGVEAVDSPPSGPNGAGSDVDGVLVHAGSVVTFRIDLTNGGTGLTGYGVGGADVWDVLPPGVRCDAVANVRLEPTPATAPTVACTDPGDAGHPAFAGAATSSLLRVVEAFDPADPVLLEPGATESLLYDMTVPSSTSVSASYPNTASVRSYQVVTDAGDAATLYPQDNVDPTVPDADQLAPAASDASEVHTADVIVAKTGTTSIAESGNDAANQATIGERVTYTYSATVPAHTTVYSGTLTDSLPTGFRFEAPATLEYRPDATSTATAPLPAGVSIDPATGTVTFPATYVNDTDADEQFVVTADATVTSAALGTGDNDQVRTNTAAFDSLDAPGGTPLPDRDATYAIHVVQPAPAISKSNDSPTVVGGDTVTYTVTASNPAGRPPLHDAVLTDCVPGGLTFAAYGADPGDAPVAGDGTNGCPTGTTLLRWTVGDVAGGATVTRTYTADVNANPVAGTSLSNTATVTGSSVAGANPDERTYARSATSTITVAGTQITKIVNPDRAPVGATVTWQVHVSVPPNTQFYDAALLDTLPDGVSDVTVTSTTCTTGGSPCPLDVTELDPDTSTPGQTTIGWGIGDHPTGPTPIDIVLTYTGVLDPAVASNVAGATLTNTAWTAWDTTNGDDPTSVTHPFDVTGDRATATVTVLEPSLSIAKAVDDTTPGPGDTFSYVVDVTNSGAATSSTAYGTVVTDQVPAGVVVDPATISAGGTLSGADATTGGGTITWAAGSVPPIAPGDTVRLTYSARLAPSSTLTAAPLTNTATVERYTSLDGGGRQYTGPSATATVTPAFPHITTTKTAVDGAPAYIGTPYTWRVDLTNTGGAPAYNVSGADVLPPGWVYVAGSAVITQANGTVVQQDPIVTGRTLRWTRTGTMLPGQSANVTFQATPTTDVILDPGVGSGVAHTNSARVFAQDATGESGNLDGPYGGDPATASTRIDSADLTVTKTHDDPVQAGADATWHVTVTNDGADTAVGTFEVTDAIPAGTTFVSASGTGWTCTGTTTVTCVHGDDSEQLANGASLPVLTIVTAVPATTAAGTTLTNTAHATDRTYDPDLDNNDATSTATVTTAADVEVTKEHSGTFVAGQTASWTIGVVNHGPSVAQAPVTVTDTLPAGVSDVEASGTGWTCDVGATTVTCTRAALGVTVAPDITLTGTIDPNATGSLDNAVTVESPTTDPDTSNNRAVDPATLATSADLGIQKMHRGSMTAGSTGHYRFEVTNTGPSRALAPHVVDTLPVGLTYAGSTDVTGTWDCSGSSGRDVVCDLGGPLDVGDSATVEIDVDIASSVTGTIDNTATVSSDTPDPNSANNSDDDSTGATITGDLSVTKTHTGTATAGEQFDWSVVVHNGGPSDHPGPFTLTDTLPVGTSYVSATGTGWACDATGRTVTCDHAGGLPAGDDAATITVTAAVAADVLPGTLTNTATVSSAVDDTDPTNDTATDPTDVGTVADVAITKDRVGTGAVPAGSDVDYTIVATNNGPSDAQTVLVTDTAPPGLVPTDVTPPAGGGWTCGIAGRVVTCSRGDLAAGASATFAVTATTDPALAAGTDLTNTARIASATTDSDTTNNEDTASITIVTRADLVLTKTHLAAGTTFHSGQRVTFRVAVHNDGPSQSVLPLVVDDTLPAGFSYVSSLAPWSCAAATATDVTCTLSTGDPVLPGGDAPVLTIVAQIDPAADAGVYENTATVTPTTPDPDATNNTDTDRVPVTPEANVSVAKTHLGTAHVGDDTTFVIQVHNDGPSQARDVHVDDVLPRGLTYVSAVGVGWTCDHLGPAVGCDLDTPLDPRTDAPRILVTATVGAAAYPTARNVADVRTSTEGDRREDNTAADTLAVPPLVDLSVVKSHTGTFVVGQDAVWHLDVANAGPTDDPGPVRVVDQLPAGVTYVSTSAPGWACSASGSRVTCALADGLAVDEHSALDLTVAVDPGAYPSVTNTATITSPAEDTDPSNNTATDPADVQAVSHLEVTKTVVRQTDTTATFGIVVTNHGPNATTTPVVVTDPIPAGLLLTSAHGTGWTCASAGTVVTCQYDASLAVGASTPRLTVETAITADPGTTVVNVATAGGGQPDPCPTCGDSDSAQVLPGKGDLAATGTDARDVGLLALVLLTSGVALVRLRRAGRA